MSLKVLAADQGSRFRSFQRDFAKTALECILAARTNPRGQLNAPIYHLENAESYLTDIEVATAAGASPFFLNVIVCLPAAPDDRPAAEHVLLERWVLDMAPRPPQDGEAWNQVAETARLGAFEKQLRTALRELPLHALLRAALPVSAAYGRLPGEPQSFIHGGCSERVFALESSGGSCRLLLEHRADLAFLKRERDFILAFVPQTTSAVAPCYHPPVQKAHMNESPEPERRSSPSISIGKLSLHRSDGAATHGPQYGRRGFSLVSPPQLGSSPPVRRLSSSSSAVGAAVGARSPQSPSDFGPFVGSMEESLLSGHVSTTACTVLTGFTADLVVNAKDDPLSPRDRARFPPHKQIPFDALYYHIGDTAPYVATLPLDERGHRIPARGTVQLTLRNPSRTPFKTFLVPFDLTTMPAETKTFIRQKVLRGNPPRTCYALHLRFSSPKAGVYFLAKRIKILFPMRLPDEGEELRTVLDHPRDPQYFPY